MKISIDNSLKEIADGLIRDGHQVYSINDNMPCDICIYSDENNNLTNIYKKIEVDENSTLIINAHGKSLNEIRYSINKKTYSPLF